MVTRKKAAAKKTAPATKKATSTRGATKESKAPTSKKATSTRGTAKKTTQRSRSRRLPRRPREGTVAASVYDELKDAGLLLTAHGTTALRVAKSVDEADSANAVAVAARELRMQLNTVRSVGAALPPLPGDETPQGGSPEDELARMRERSNARRRSS